MNAQGPRFVFRNVAESVHFWYVFGRSVCAFIRPSVRLSVYLSVCLLVSLPVYGGRGVGGQVRASAVRALQCVAPVGDSYAIDACLNKTHHHQWFVRASALEGLCLVCPSGDDRIIQVCPVSLSPRLICSCTRPCACSCELSLVLAHSLAFGGSCLIVRVVAL